MDQQIENVPNTYQGWIDQGNSFVGVNATAAFLSYEEALALAEDKFEPYFLLAQAYRIDRSSWPAVRNLVQALDFSNNKIERLISIANEFEKLSLNYIALDIFGQVKEADPNYDHQVPKTLEDYENIGIYELNNSVKEYIRQGQVQQASKSIEKLIELNDNKIEVLLSVGKQIVEDRSSKELAEQYFERALKHQQDNYDLLLRIGDIYLSNFPELSTKYYEQAKVQKPESFEPKLRLVSQKLELQQFQEALDQLKNEQVPEDKQIYLDIGLLLSNKDQTYDEGLGYILKGIDISQNKFETLFELSKLEKLNGNKLKKVLLEKALELDPNHIDSLVLYGMHIYLYEERSQKTIDVFKKVLELNPQQEFFFTYLGQTLVELGRIEEAIEELKKGAVICPQYLFLLTLGKLLLEKKQVEDAIHYFYFAIEQDATNSYYEIGIQTLYLVKLLFENNCYQECLQVCDEFAELHPENEQSYLFKAKSLVALQSYDEAIPLIEKTISLDNYFSNIEAKELLQKIENIKSGKQEDQEKQADVQ